VGIITLPDGRHIAIAVYIADSSADMWQREKVIADIAAAVCEKWAPEFKPDEATKGV
jgi:beta-lactamase class A